MTGFGESSYRRNPAKDPRELERLVLTYADSLVRYAYSIVGSSATIIATMFRENQIPIPAELAGLMLGAVLSDTVV